MPMSNMKYFCESYHLDPYYYPSSNPTRPVTAPRQKRSQLLQELPVHLVEATHLRAIDVDDGDHRARPRISLEHNRNDNLALAVPVAGDMAGELLDVRDELGLCRRSRSAAHATPKGNRLAGHLPLEGAQDQRWG